jgi:hypothetical protein
MPMNNSTVKALFVGVAAAGAILALAPIASADDPPPSDQQQQPAVDPAQFIDPALSAMQQLPSGGLPTGGLPMAGGVPGVYTPSGVGTGGEVLINGIPTYIPPEGLTLPPGAQVGPPTAWIESVKQTGCAPDCVPEMYRYLFEKAGDTAQDVVGAATPPQQDDKQQPPAPRQ